MHKSMDHGCEHVIFHRLIIKEYCVELKLIKVKNNEVAHSLSIL